MRSIRWLTASAAPLFAFVLLFSMSVMAQEPVPDDVIDSADVVESNIASDDIEVGPINEDEVQAAAVVKKLLNCHKIHQKTWSGSFRTDYDVWFENYSNIDTNLTTFVYYQINGGAWQKMNMRRSVGLNLTTSKFSISNEVNKPITIRWYTTLTGYPNTAIGSYTFNRVK